MTLIQRMANNVKLSEYAWYCMQFSIFAWSGFHSSNYKAIETIKIPVKYWIINYQLIVCCILDSMNTDFPSLLRMKALMERKERGRRRRKTRRLTWKTSSVRWKWWALLFLFWFVIQIRSSSCCIESHLIYSFNL